MKTPILASYHSRVRWESSLLKKYDASAASIFMMACPLCLDIPTCPHAACFPDSWKGAILSPSCLPIPAAALSTFPNHGNDSENRVYRIHYYSTSPLGGEGAALVAKEQRFIETLRNSINLRPTHIAG